MKLLVHSKSKDNFKIKKIMKLAKKNHLAIILVSIILVSCGENKSKEKVSEIKNSDQVNSTAEKTKDPNSSPETVMNTIFNAAKTGEVGVLRFLLPSLEETGGEPNYDGDCKALCNPGNESMREEIGGNYMSLDEFKSYFSKGKIVGSPVINGDDADVDFVFGPELEKNETMHMQRIKGKWYLSGF